MLAKLKNPRYVRTFSLKRMDGKKYLTIDGLSQSFLGDAAAMLRSIGP